MNRPQEVNATSSRALARRLAPMLAVAGSCALSLILLRAELTQVPYLNDSAMHEEMVSAALGEIRAGHFPPASWFAFLNLGSPQFLHYQSLGAMLTALSAWAIGVGDAFRLTTWLLVACWPLCVYGAARVLGLSRGAAVSAALLSPFVSSATGVGYEQISYLWSGYGLWSQLFAMWTLPFAWALSWRAVEEHRFVAPAAVLVAATAAFHFETGYLAFLGVFVFVFVRPSDAFPRAGRALLVAGGAAALSAWAVVPLVAQGKWAAVNQFLQSGPEGADANSYGAGRVLSWLVNGDLFDWHHVEVITPLLLVGLACCLGVWRRPSAARPIPQGPARALVVVFALSLVLFFGRPTLGPLLDLLPGSKNLFLRRFLVGVQLSGLLLAGAGAASLATWTAAATRRATRALHEGDQALGNAVGGLAVGCLSLAVLFAGWSFVNGQAQSDATFISAQSSQGSAAAQLGALVAIVKSDGGGRTFAGDPSDWGDQFTVGEVPVYEYLADESVDEVGLTLRTASLMSDPEVDFDETNPADYAAFGVRWLILPSNMAPPVPAKSLLVRGAYALWELPANGYVQLVDTRGVISADSGDLGSASRGFLARLSSKDPVYPTVAYEGGPAAAATLRPGEVPPGPAGRVLSEEADLADGEVVADLDARRTAVVVLSASFDPGWQAQVDGRPAVTEMVAPALVGVRVGPGHHTVRFFYRGFPDYWQLTVVGSGGLVALLIFERRSRRRRRPARQAQSA